MLFNFGVQGFNVYRGFFGRGSLLKNCWRQFHQLGLLLRYLIRVNIKLLIQLSDRLLAFVSSQGHFGFECR